MKSLAHGMGWEGKSQISDVRGAQTNVWVALELVKNDKGMVMWKEFILWTNPGNFLPAPCRGFWSHLEEAALGWEKEMGSPQQSQSLTCPQDFSDIWTGMFVPPVVAQTLILLENQLLNAMGEPSRGKKFISNLHTPIHLHSRHFLLQILFFFNSWKEKGNFSPA